MIAIHLSSPDKFWQGLIAAIERPDLAADERFAKRMSRIANHEALRDILRSVFRLRSRDDWMARLDTHDVPHAPIYSIEEALNDPEVRRNGMEQHLEHPTDGKLRTLRRPVIYDRDRASIVMTPPPVLDEHGSEVRASYAAKDKPKQ